MKKMICFILTIMLILSSATMAYAKPHNGGGKGNKHHQNKRGKETKYKFKIKDSSIIKYGRYQLPIEPITKGMGGTVSYDKKTKKLTVSKGSTTIVIDFDDKAVTVNGVIDKNSGIFTAKNSKKMIVLIVYIAKILGVDLDIDDDDIVIVVPEMDLITNVTVIPVGSTVVKNTLNSTTQYLLASAKIKAGQATGGRAELYVGPKLVAADNSIGVTDTTVDFTTSDGTPTNGELQYLIPAGGAVSVKLYKSDGKYVTSTTSNPTLFVDYVAPTITTFTSAIYDTTNNQLSITVSGAGTVGDIVDVTKISLTDIALNKTYQLTNNGAKGSSGKVTSSNRLDIMIGSNDKLGLAGFASTTTYLTIATGSLLKDTAGNSSISFTNTQIIPVSVAFGLDAPTNVTVTPVGTMASQNILNTTTQYINASAKITAGQATGGRAELYVGSKLIAFDNSIFATDTTVNFTTTDGTPTNGELQLLVPTSGIVTVKLYNGSNKSVVSSVGNPKLDVDYIPPTLTGITSAVYDVSDKQLHMIVTGAGAKDDIVDVTKVSLYDVTLGRTYQLTSNSTGYVSSTNSLIINLGSIDRNGLTGFGGSTVYLTVTGGSLLKDKAGNTSPVFGAQSGIPVIVIK